jgi:DNA-binding response OmpR family regulator
MKGRPVMKNRVLMIDDDQELCEEMAELLRDHGYHIQMAFDGLEGLKRLEEDAYDVLLLDLKIPRLDGMELLKIIKSRSMKHKTLVVTGKPLVLKTLTEIGEPDPDPAVLAALADGVISKPFDVQGVLSIIRDLAGQA